jgi:2-hydroxychromene-2-carboxylate isomerase
MANPIDFYFDYSSPYGYIAAMKIDDIAARHGRAVNWKPILLGAVFKVTVLRDRRRTVLGCRPFGPARALARARPVLSHCHA